MKKSMCIQIICSILIIFCIVSCSKDTAKDIIPIPKDATVLITLTDLENSWTNFNETQLMQEMKKLALWEDPAVKAVLSNIKINKDDTNSILNEKTLMMMLGNHVEVAVMPGTPFPKVMLCTDLGDKAPIMKIVELINQKFGEQNIRIQKYRDFEVKMVTIESNTEIAYYFYDTKMIFCSDFSIAQSTIDILNDSSETLFQNERYNIAIDQLPEYANKLFIDMPKLESILRTFQPPDDIKIKINSGDFDLLAAGWQYENNQIAGTAITRYLPDYDIKKAFGKPATAKDIAEWIPEESLMISLGAIKIPELMKLQKQKMEKLTESIGENPWEKIMEQVNTALGVDLETEIMKWAGDGMFFNIQTVNSQGMFPMPETVIGIQVKDSEKANDFLNKIEGIITANFSEKNLQFSETTIADTPARYLPLPLGPNIAPCYLTYDDVVIIGTSTAAIEKAIQTHNGKFKKLTESEKFQTVASSGLKNYVAFQYFDSAQFFETLKSLVNNYRMFFPQGVDPDHVRDAFGSLSHINGYYSDVAIQDDAMLTNATLLIK